METEEHERAGREESRADAGHALALAADAETRMVTAVARTPRWYAPAYGVVIATFVTAGAAHGAGWGIGAALLLFVYLAGLSALVHAYRHAVGAWPTWTRGTVPTAVATGLGLAVLLLVAHQGAGAWGQPWLVVASILASGVGGGAASRLHDRRWAADQGHR